MMAADGDSSGGGSLSTISKVDAVEQDCVVTSEVSSYSMNSAAAAAEDIDLVLALSLNPRSKPSARVEFCRFLTAEDFQPMFSSSRPARASVTGVKRAADSFASDGGSNSPSHVVGWPPIRSYRMNNLANQTKAPAENGTKKNMKASCNKVIQSSLPMGTRKSLFVKVNMDGVPIGRKVDLSVHTCYRSLAQALEDMFHRPMMLWPCEELKAEVANHSVLSDGSSQFVLTYEDREGDWMLVGDVPWQMFLNTVRRLRIMKSCEANGLGPAFIQDDAGRHGNPI